MGRVIPDASSVSAESVFVWIFGNMTLILPCPGVWCLPFCGRRLQKEPLCSLTHPQPCSKCHASRVRVLLLQYPGRVEEPELSGGLLVDYLIAFCFVLSFICPSWDQSPGLVSIFIMMVLCKQLPRVSS